jgi:hypothetical protein
MSEPEERIFVMLNLIQHPLPQRRNRIVAAMDPDLRQDDGGIQGR